MSNSALMPLSAIIYIKERFHLLLYSAFCGCDRFSGITIWHTEIGRQPSHFRVADSLKQIWISRANSAEIGRRCRIAYPGPFRFNWVWFRERYNWTTVGLSYSFLSGVPVEVTSKELFANDVIIGLLNNQTPPAPHPPSQSSTVIIWLTPYPLCHQLYYIQNFFYAVLSSFGLYPPTPYVIICHNLANPIPAPKMKTSFLPSHAVRAISLRGRVWDNTNFWMLMAFLRFCQNYYTIATTMARTVYCFSWKITKLQNRLDCVRR